MFFQCFARCSLFSIQFLIGFLIFLRLRSHLFHPDPAKIQETLKLVADCWEMQFPPFFHLSCWSFHGWCHRFWWVLIRHFLQSFPCFSPWNCEKHSISIALYSLCFSKVLLAVHCLFLIDFVIFFYGLRSHRLHPNPAKIQETLAVVAEWALLSTAEKCNPQPFSICFVEVFMFFWP